MKSRLKLGSAALIVAFSSVTVLAAESYQASLKAGDANRKAMEYEAAISEYSEAYEQAANNTQKALALGKKAYVYAYDKRDYLQARGLANKALMLNDVEPVAEVTLLQVVAECQFREDKDHETAVATLEKALALEGVDWAKPTLALAMGDCYRLSNEPGLACKAYYRVLDMPSANKKVRATALLNIGLARQYGLRAYPEARDAYNKAIELNPDLQTEVEDHLSRIK